MKILHHPAVEDITVEGLLHALSDPVRVQILKEIMRSNSPKTCSDFLNMPDRAIPKSTLSQHFRILREAGLIRSERSGVALKNTPRCRNCSPALGGCWLKFWRRMPKSTAEMIRTNRAGRRGVCA